MLEQPEQIRQNAEEAAARYLAAKGGISAVVSSPLQRAHDTATPQFISSPGYEHAWLNPDNTEVSIEDLLVMKALAGRPQDDQDILGLVATQRTAIDWPACLGLAEKLGAAIDIDIASRLRAAREK